MRWWKGAVAAGVGGAAVAGSLAVTDPARQYVGTLPPDQFYQPVDDSALRGRSEMFGVAHNAGDHVGSARVALGHGAAAIEIDVISADGAVVASRPQQPWPWLAEQLNRGPTLGEIWRRTADAPAVMLDLKETDRDLLASVVAFLRAHADGRIVMVSARDPDALLYLGRRLDRAVLLLTLAFPPAVTQLRSNSTLLRSIDGVSVYEGLLDTALVRWLHHQRLLVVAWPVNSRHRLRDLAAAGVDGITTDNLAFLQQLGADLPPLRR